MSHPQQFRRLFQSDLIAFQSHLDKLREIAQTLPQGDGPKNQLEEILRSMAEIAVNMNLLIAMS